MGEEALRGVAPSILSADFARLGAGVREVLDAGARVIHVDVMDGTFVPPITMGALVVDALKSLAAEAAALLDVHLMVDRPERHVHDFASAGADVITIHAEATPHVHFALSAVRDAGCRAGLAICPATPVEAVSELTADVDLVLCMTVDPGWGGQAFLEHSIDKLRRLRRLVGPDVAVEVDGGIDRQTAPRCASAGATVFVAGTSVVRRRRSGRGRARAAGCDRRLTGSGVAAPVSRRRAGSYAGWRAPYGCAKSPSTHASSVPVWLVRSRTV